jgi:hypothetical protein
MKKLLLILFFTPMLVLAKGDDCINEHNRDQREFCMAKQYANATQCDTIKSIELRMQCVSVVKIKQRDSMWAIKPMNLSTADIRTETKYFNR